jgi:hypothetical protein
MERRNFVKAAGGIGAGLTVGGAGLATFAGGAAATVNFTPTSVSYTSVDGSVDAVLLNPSGHVEWGGYDSGVTSLDIELGVKRPSQSTYEVVQTQTITDLGPEDGARQTDDEGVAFDLERVDLTEASRFDDAYFESDTDGESVTSQVDVQISVGLNREDGQSETTDSASRFDVTVANQANTESATADVDATVEFVGNIYSTNTGQGPSNDTGENAYLEFDFSRLSSDGVVVMTEYLENYVDDVSSGAPLNSPIAFDADKDGSRDFQVIWQPGSSGPEFEYLNESSGSTQDVTNIGDVNVSLSGSDDTWSGTTVTWEIDQSQFGGLSSGDTFRVGGNATAGGEEESVVFSDDIAESEFVPANMLTVIVP